MIDNDHPAKRLIRDISLHLTFSSALSFALPRLVRKSVGKPCHVSCTRRRHSFSLSIERANHSPFHPHLHEYFANDPVTFFWSYFFSFIQMHSTRRCLSRLWSPLQGKTPRRASPAEAVSSIQSGVHLPLPFNHFLQILIYLSIPTHPPPRNCWRRSVNGLKVTG